MINLDTHIFLAVLEGSLRRRELAALDADAEWCIADIVLFEIGLLEARGRISTSLDQPELSGLLGDIRVVPIDLSIAKAIRVLDFRSDPADMIIAATSLALDIPLLTRDSRIHESKVVPLIRL